MNTVRIALLRINEYQMRGTSRSRLMTERCETGHGSAVGQSQSEGDASRRAMVEGCVAASSDDARQLTRE